MSEENYDKLVKAFHKDTEHLTVGGLKAVEALRGMFKISTGGTGAIRWTGSAKQILVPSGTKPAPPGLSFDPDVGSYIPGIKLKFTTGKKRTSAAMPAHWLTK